MKNKKLSLLIVFAIGASSFVMGASTAMVEYRVNKCGGSACKQEVGKAKRDYYEVLGITKKASVAEIRIAYRKLAVKVHPDKHPNDAKAAAAFRELSEAYQILSDEGKRKIYDQKGFKGQDANAPSSDSYEGFVAEAEAFFNEEEPDCPKDYWNSPFKWHDNLQFLGLKLGQERQRLINY